jgi:FlaA1/EpsC-like NDP-sugar epimerase
MPASSRKDSFTIQALQIMDAFLVWAAFWLASLLRGAILTFFYGGTHEYESLYTMMWALYIAVPFTPLVLEHFGFYKRLGSKTAHSAAWQLIQGIFIIGLFISLFALFAKVEGTRRLILGLGGVMMFFLLFIRERILHS